MSMVIIGLLGLSGSGKSTARQTLIELCEKASYQTASCRFSDILSETLALWGVPKTRANLQKLAVVMDDVYGEGTLSKALRLRINDFSAQIVFVDGVRWPTDVDLIRSFPNNMLIYLVSPAKDRFKRITKRGEKEDDTTTTWEQFMKEDEACNEVEISRLGRTADEVIYNNQTISDFIRKLEQVFRESIALKAGSP